MTSPDVVVLGAGFAGSIAACIARRAGLDVLLVERGRHPRFAIGESTTPLSNLVLASIGRRFDLPWLTELSEWGRIRQAHPELRVGLKRGFSFFGHGRRLHVAASPNNRVADTHWVRRDVDAFLLARAREIGVRYLDRAVVEEAIEGPHGLRLRLSGGLELSPRLVVDATGSGKGLARALGIRDVGFPALPPRWALFAHFEGVSDPGEPDRGAPYPVRWSGQHHLVRGGWLWSLRFDDDRVSAGVILERGRRPAVEAGAEPRDCWQTFLDEEPALRRAFGDARTVEPVRRIEQVGRQLQRSRGRGWWLTPSAAAFVGPLLSTGFALTLTGLLRFGEALHGQGAGVDLGIGGALDALAVAGERDVARAADLVGALWHRRDDFSAFSALTMTYFAAASWMETRIRLGESPASAPFLAGDHPSFGPGLRRLCADVVGGPVADLDARVRTLIAPINVAGLHRSDAAGCYPVRAEDLRAAAPAHGWSVREIERLLREAGMAPHRE